MDSFSLYRERIGESLTRRLADAIGDEVVTDEQAAEISQDILSRIDAANNHQELMDFVEELAHKWPLFGPVLVSEQSQQVEQHISQQEDQAVSEVENLLKENKIDEALATAENANKGSEEEASQLPDLTAPPPTPPAEGPSEQSQEQSQEQPQTQGGQTPTEDVQQTGGNE